MEMKYFSLFSGIGGFELGIKNKGKCIGFSEIDKYAIQIYKKHFPNHKEYGNATKIKTEELPNFDLLVAGFPCQSFSVAGKGKGFQDTRGTLFFEIIRILQDKRPRYFLLENVKGLFSNKNGKTFQTILEVLSDIGYLLQWEVLNSKNFGVLQNRERVFIIGHFRGTSRPEVFPIRKTNKNYQNQNKKLSMQITNTLRTNYPNSNANATYIETKKGWRAFTPIECERLQGFPDGWTEGISDTQRYKCLGNAVTVNVIKEIIRKLIK